MSNWKHIDTVPAPKDGREFLVCYSRRFKPDGEWYKNYAIVKWDDHARDFVGRCEGGNAYDPADNHLLPWFNYWQDLPEIDVVEE